MRLSLPKRKQKRHGFALVASMILMMLLAIIAVGLMVLASTQNRIAMQNMFVAAARQQALVGLDVAIGQLQIEMGPDQRVSANSGILADSEHASARYLLGVWNSWDGPIYGTSISGKGSKISETYEKGREKMFRRWLISSKNASDATQMNNYEQLSTRAPGERICLVGEGTLGSQGRTQDYIYADLITMPQEKNLQAQFAWWIGGENQKAKVAIQDREESDNALDALARTWDTPAPMFVESESLNFLPERIDHPDKILSMGTLPLVSDGSQDAGYPYFFDVSTHSYSLATNVRTGGFKQDLNLLLNKKTLEGTEFATRSNQDCPIVEQGGDVPNASETLLPIGSWPNLHAYFHTWPDGTANDKDNFTARLLGTVDNAYTRMSGSAYRSGNFDDSLNKGVSGPETAFNNKVNTDKDPHSGYARTPIMLAFMNNFGLVSEDMGTQTTDGEDTIYRLQLCYAPMVLWWNPYNVPMKVRGQQVWSHSAPYKTMWLQSYAISQGGTWTYSWSSYAMQQTHGTGPNDAGFGRDFGEFLVPSIASQEADINFAPGEIIFFSPGQARIDEDRVMPFRNPWIPGYDPSNVSGYRAHYYQMSGASTQAGVASKTNIDDRKFYLRLRLGTGNQPSGSYQTDGGWFAGGHNECITVHNGYAGASEEVPSDTANSEKYGQSPQRFMLGWYPPADTNIDTTICSETRDDTYWTTDGTQNDPTQPFYVASLGVTVKSANSELGVPFVEGDFRSKIWQHSSPAFWSGYVVDPDDQQRAYNPFQLARVNVSGGLSSSPMDNIGRNGYLGITSGGEQVSFAAVSELPIHPPFSLAGFSGMRLLPGWFKSSDDSFVASFWRMQYQAGVPGVGIGNSFADPTIPAGDIYTTHESPVPDGVGKIFNDYYDHGVLINDALWDRFFCSSIADRPKSGSGRITAEEVLTQFLDGTEELPVSRYKKIQTPYNNKSIVERLMKDDGWKYVAQYIMIDGGFNVNSTSIEAWAATLQGLANRKLVTNAGGKLGLVEEGKDRTEVLFSRFMCSTANKSNDSLGGYSPMQGSTSLRSGGGAMTAAWGEVRKLNTEGIRLLAEEIVKQVRERGPFLSMSDFINRRLDSSDEEKSLMGALQAAIEETDINADMREEMISSNNSGNFYRFGKAAEGSIHTAAPGYLIQSDILMSLGNILTVRDDTFTVRAYGCIKRGDTVLAQAWCEAIVQRTPDYVDPTNKPSDSEYKPDGTQAEGLSNVNKLMGRKMKIVTFRWLDHWDI